MCVCVCVDTETLVIKIISIFFNLLPVLVDINMRSLK